MGMEIVVNSLEEMCALMCDNRIPTGDQTMRDKIEWLIGEYESAVDGLTNDYRESKSMLNNSYRTGKIGVYSKVIKDLQEILEEGEEE